MRKLLLVAGIASLVSIPLFFAPKPKFQRSKVYIGEKGDHKTLASFKAWLEAEQRSSASKLLTIILDSKSIPDMKDCWEWIRTVDLVGQNIRIHLFSVPPSNSYTIVDKIATT